MSGLRLLGICMLVAAFVVLVLYAGWGWTWWLPWETRDARLCVDLRPRRVDHRRALVRGGPEMNRIMLLTAAALAMTACNSPPSPNALVCTLGDQRTVMRPIGGGSIGKRHPNAWNVGASVYVQRPGELCQREYVP